MTHADATTRISTGLPGFTLRHAVEADVPQILAFIHGLAEYERLTHEVYADAEGLRRNLFGPHPYAEVILAEEEGRPVGFALFHHNFSTFVGKPGLYLEDLFVLPDARGKGYGKVLMAYLAALAVQRGCGRFEWSVLDWNAPSIAFYRGLGAQPMDDWTVFRVSGEALQTLAKEGGSG